MTYTPNGLLQGLVLSTPSRRYTVDELVVGSPQLDLSSGEVSQLTFTLSDPKFELLASGAVALGAAVDYADLRMEVAAIATGGDDAPTLEVTARSRGVLALKARKGALVAPNISPTDFARNEASSVGLDFVGQPSAALPQVARTETPEGEQEPESSWDVITRIASEIGYVVFEAANVLYFAKPSWLLTRSGARRHTVRYPTDVFGVPACRRSAGGKPAVTIEELTISQSHAVTMRPGDLVTFVGVPTFDGDYIVTNVPVTVDGVTPVALSIATPVDPEPRPPKAPDPLYKETMPELAPFGDDVSFGTVESAGGVGGISRGWVWPAVGKLTSPFGPRAAPKAGASSFHKGVDIANAEGTPVYASRAGRIVKAGVGSGYGNVVYIDHGDGTSSRYAHLSRIVVSDVGVAAAPPRSVGRAVGDTSYRPPEDSQRSVGRAVGDTQYTANRGRVSQGQLIGYMGRTGNVTGVHLHFEILNRGAQVDPLKLLGGTPSTGKRKAV